MPVNKIEIEKALDEINGVIMDFAEAAESLKGVKETLLKLLEKEPEDERCGIPWPNPNKIPGW